MFTGVSILLSASILWLVPGKLYHRCKRGNFLVSWCREKSNQILGCFVPVDGMILLMVQKSGDHHAGGIKPYKWWDIYHINWCRISSINSINVFSFDLTFFCNASWDFYLPWDAIGLLWQPSQVSCSWGFSKHGSWKKLWNLEISLR